MYLFKLAASFRGKGRLILKSLWYLQFFQKTNEKIRPNYYGTSSLIVFVGFFEEFEDAKKHFETN